MFEVTKHCQSKPTIHTRYSIHIVRNSQDISHNTGVTKQFNIMKLYI